MIKVHRIERFELWFDRSDRVWFAMEVDGRGFQIGDGFHSATREEIEIEIRRRISDR